MEILEKLAESIVPGQVLSVQVGVFRTAVVVETGEGIRCGLAATTAQSGMEMDHPIFIHQAGNLQQCTTSDLVELIYSDQPAEVSIGLAAINALQPPVDDPKRIMEENAEQYIFQRAPGQRIAVIGHFPFVTRLPQVASQAWCLELCPRPGDLPADLAPTILPQADVVVITATTLINHTLDDLLHLCRSDAEIILLGPSTPLSPVLYEYGISILSGIFVDAPRKVAMGVSQGATLRQLFQQGWIRYVNVTKEQWHGMG